jgi:class 3 adenylate cyclase
VTVTVVFTDLVGSTTLLSRVGPTVGERLRVEHFTVLRDAVKGHGGREVKNTGDGLMLVFDSPAAAVSCAVAMQQALAARPLDAEPLRIRVGVSVGEVDVDDDDYFGLPVVEAARLCAHADADEVLVSDLVRLLARSRSPFPLEPVGALELKGLAEPVEAHRVRWEPLPRAGAALPVPARMSAGRSSVFVGRASEREVLEDAFKDVCSGNRRGVLISGEPGIGKTTLAATFAVSTSERDAWVLYGRCDEDLFVPYQPWVEALGHLVEHVPEELLADHVRERGAVLARLVPHLARRLVIEPPAAGAGAADEERHLLFTAVVDLLSRAAARAPLVLLLDDLHWADQPSTQLLRHLLAAATTDRLLVVGTFRDSDVGRATSLAELLAALHREQGVDRIRLRGLGDDELLALLEMLAGHEMGAEGVALRNALLAEADGNPYFTTELLRHLVDTGAVARNSEGRWSAPSDLPATGLPVSIREVVGARHPVGWRGGAAAHARRRDRPGLRRRAPRPCGGGERGSGRRAVRGRHRRHRAPRDRRGRSLHLRPRPHRANPVRLVVGHPAGTRPPCGRRGAGGCLR